MRLRDRSKKQPVDEEEFDPLPVKRKGRNAAEFGGEFTHHKADYFEE